jgi:hypothetical protein
LATRKNCVKENTIGSKKMTTKDIGQRTYDIAKGSIFLV